MRVMAGDAGIQRPLGSGCRHPAVPTFDDLLQDALVARGADLRCEEIRRPPVDGRRVGMRRARRGRFVALLAGKPAVGSNVEALRVEPPGGLGRPRTNPAKRGQQYQQTQAGCPVLKSSKEAIISA